MLHPGVQLAAQFTDNVFYTNSDGEADTRSDTVWHFRPYITAQSNWTRHSFNVRLAADIARHQEYGFRDYEDYFLLMNGQVDVRNRSIFSYNLDYMNLHEGAGSRDAEQGLEPTRYDLYAAGIGYDHTFNRLSIGAKYGYGRLDFDDAYSLEDGVIDNQDRDRDRSQWSLRLGYQFQTDKQAFVSFAGNQVKYDQFLDRNGINRNSDGWTANAGLALTITGKLNGDVFVTYHDQSYDDPVLNGVSGWAGGLGLQWSPTQMTRVGASITSSVQQTTYQYSSGYLMTLYSLRADHELTRSLQISGQVSYRNNDYQLSNDAPEDARTRDEIWQAGVGLNYFINRYAFLNASYNHERLTSSVPTDRYNVNTVWLTLSLER
jgi:hypothetical protein